MMKEARNPNDEKPVASPIRHSSFDILSSFVIRHLSFIRDLRLKYWLAVGAAALAVILTGDRLRLSSSNPNVLRFAHTFTTESERAIIDAAIAEFEKANPPLRVEQIVLNSEVYQTIGWRLQFQGRQQPDVYFLWQGYKVDYVIENAWALEVSRYVSAGFLDQFVPAAIRRLNNGIYLLPQSADISNLVWYNRELFAKHNLGEPRTLEEWLRLCAALRQAGLLPLVQGNRDLWPMGNFGAELLGQSIGADRLRRLFTPGDAIMSVDLRGLKTFEWLEQNGGFDLPPLMERGAIGGFGDIDAKVFFLSGKAAQHIVGSWFLADIQDARQKNELKFTPGFFPVPAGAGETNAMTSVTTGYVVNPATKNPKATFAFVELLLSRKYQSQFAALGNLSARRDAVEFTTDPLARRMLEVMATTDVMVPPPDTGYSADQANVFYELCAKLLTGKLTVHQAADTWTREKQNLAKKGL
jgi:raffinose/stachyose/melibiose transport system substrate-binding protein